MKNDHTSQDGLGLTRSRKKDTNREVTYYCLRPELASSCAHVVLFTHFKTWRTRLQFLTIQDGARFPVDFEKVLATKWFDADLPRLITTCQRSNPPASCLRAWALQRSSTFRDAILFGICVLAVKLTMRSHGYFRNLIHDPRLEG